MLRDVSVRRDAPLSPGGQLEGQLAAMVREGRIGPGRRLPSTRRAASRLGLHRNTVAAAYRRLASRGLLEVRHGARARVCARGVGVGGRGDAEGGDGSVAGVLAVAPDEGSARLMAAEISTETPDGVVVEWTSPADVDLPTQSPGAGSETGPAGRRRLAVALPGTTGGRIVGFPGGGASPSWIRARQCPRTEVARALRRARPLDVVAVATGSRCLREAVLCDAARIRGGELTVRSVPVGLATAGRIDRAGDSPVLVRKADLVIADRLAADALCGAGFLPGHRELIAARLVSAETLGDIADRLAEGHAGENRISAS